MRLSADDFDLGREHVAHAAFRADHGDLGPLGIQLAAQAADLDVDGAVENVVAVQTRKVEQRVSRQDALGHGQKGGGQVEHEVQLALNPGVHGQLLLGCAVQELGAGVRALGRGSGYQPTVRAKRRVRVTAPSCNGQGADSDTPVAA